jgi:multiple sugar transport system substrate-binding protein
MIRKTLAALLASGAMLAATAAGAAEFSFMSFTVAEEGNRPDIEKLMAEFKAAKGVDIKVYPYAWGDMLKNVFLRQRSKTLPNVVQISERWLTTIAQLPEAVDLNTVFGKEALEAAIDPKVLAMGRTPAGKQLALPWVTGSFNMIANAEVLKQAGVAEVPKTIADFRAALVAVRDKVPNSVPYPISTKNPASILQDYTLWARAYGARVIDDDGKVLIGSAENKAALNALVDMMKERLIAPEIDRPDARRLFAQGKAAFYADAVQARAHLRQFSGRGAAFDSAIKPMAMPVLKAGDQPHSVEWGHTLVLFNVGDIKPTGPAAEWLTYIMSDAGQVDYALRQGVLPVTKSARANARVQSDAYLADWAANEGAPVRNDVSAWPNAVDLTRILAEGIQAALLGQKTVDAVVAEMETQMTASMAKLKN